VLLKNVVFELSWVKLLPTSPAYSFIISTALSHLLTYPFLVVMRQLQTSDPTAAMMHKRTEKARAAVLRLWGEGGLRSFYRGFLAHSAVHLFLAALLLQANFRSGYFLE
jgi:hypothetical protein